MCPCPRRVYNDARRLIQTDQILVLIDDFYRLVRRNDLFGRAVREHDTERIPLPKTPVYKDRLPVDRDAMVCLIFRPGDIVRDELPFIQNDISHRAPGILRTDRPGKDPSGLKAMFRLPDFFIFPQNCSSLSCLNGRSRCQSLSSLLEPVYDPPDKPSGKQPDTGRCKIIESARNFNCLSLHERPVPGPRHPRGLRKSEQIRKA